MIKRSQKTEFRIQNNPAVKSGVTVMENFFLLPRGDAKSEHARLKSLALNLDSLSSLTKSILDSVS